jgi:hypothetical protein
MKLKILIAAMLVAVCAHAQNLTSVTASNIVDATNTKIASGTLCFIGTDASDNPIGYQIGGGGQVVLTPACTPITNGAISGFSVANPALTSPANIAYRITVSDSHTLVRTDKLVQFTGSPFNYDTYVPPVGTITLGVSVPVLSVGNITVSGTCTGCSSGGSGITTLNTLNGATQTFAVGTAGSNFAISSTGTAHTFNLPNASTSNRGALTSSDWNLFNGKQAAIAGNNCAARNFGNGINTAGTLLCGQPNSTQLADFSATAPSTAGKIPIYDPAATNSAGGTGAYVPGDPLVQGLVADGSTTAENPVAGGGYDTAGTPVLHRNTLLNGAPAGTEYGLVTRNIPGGTQTVSGTVTTTPPSNASTNVAQVAGTTTDTNSGSKSAGTLRVVLATDQPQLTNKILVTPDSVALPANQSVNVAQMNGVATSMGSGIMGTGVQRVAVASDNDPVTVKQATGTNLHAVIDSGSTTAVTQATGTNLHAVIDSGSTTAVTQATGTNLHAVIDTGSTTAVTQATGTNLHTIVDSGTATANQGTAAASTAGWPVTGGALAESTAAWTSATSLNTTLRLTVTGYSSVMVFLNQGTTIAGGVVTFEASDTTAFTNAYSVNCVQANSSLFGSTYTLAQSTNQALDCDVSGAAAFQIRLSTVITGTGTVNAGIMTSSMPTVPEVAVGGTVTANAGTGQFNVTCTAANCPTNTAQFGGTNVSTGTGTGGAGIPRVTVSNDSSLAANQSVNVSQINAVTPLMGNGITGTGSQRVTIASDNTAFAVNNTQQGTASQNVAQVNGVTTQTGVGASGTGSQRVAVANDSQIKPWDGTNTVTVKAASTAAAAADTSEVVQLSPNGLNPCLNPTATLVGNSTAMSGTSAVQIVGLSGSTKIYICSLSFGIGSGTTPVLTLNYGTGTACATGTTAIINAAPILPSSATVQSFTTFPSPFFVTPAGQELCYTLTGTTPTGKLILTYVQQ